VVTFYELSLEVEISNLAKSALVSEGRVNNGALAQSPLLNYNA
jgi:hypothetical protein